MSGTLDTLAEKVERIIAQNDALTRVVRRIARGQVTTDARLASHLAAGFTPIEPLVGGRDLEMLVVKEGPSDGLWQAKRLEWDGAAYGEDPDDTDDYYVEPTFGNGQCIVGTRIWAIFARTEPGDEGEPPKGVFQVVFTLPFVAVVTGCHDPFSENNLKIKVKPIRALPYSFANSEEITDVWAGADPMIVTDSMVLVFPLAPMPDDTLGINYYAKPHISVDRTTLDEPDAECITTFGDTCSQNPPSDPCLQGT